MGTPNEFSIDKAISAISDREEFIEAMQYDDEEISEYDELEEDELTFSNEIALLDRGYRYEI